MWPICVRVPGHGVEWDGDEQHRDGMSQLTAMPLEEGSTANVHEGKKKRGEN